MSVYTKLFEAKKEIGKISKDSKNPFYKSQYFDINQLLEHVEPILQNHGLLLLQTIDDNEVHSMIMDIKDGTSVYSCLKLGEYSDPQKLGSAITYYRRYTLQSLLALQAEDDDGNKAAKPPVSKVLPPNIKSDILAKLKKAKTQEDLKALYAIEISNINKYPSLKALFTNRKNEL